MNFLPDELLYSILEFLPTYYVRNYMTFNPDVQSISSELINISNVSKSFNEIFLKYLKLCCLKVCVFEPNIAKTFSAECYEYLTQHYQPYDTFECLDHILTPIIRSDCENYDFLKILPYNIVLIFCIVCFFQIEC